MSRWPEMYLQPRFLLIDLRTGETSESLDFFFRKLTMRELALYVTQATPKEAQDRRAFLAQNPWKPQPRKPKK